MRLRIHRGAQEIGGTCIEVEAAGKRVVLDIGLPLDATDEAQERLLPEIPGLRERDLLPDLHGHPGDAPLLGPAGDPQGGPPPPRGGAGRGPTTA